jgi:putative holliday junction resolvase
MKVDLDIQDQSKGRILAIDYGTRRIGLAITDLNQIIAEPISAIQVNSITEILTKVKETISTLNPVTIVIGIPKRTDGKTGTMELLVQDFITSLSAEITIPIVTWNEWFSTKEATNSLRIMGIKSKKHHGHVDSQAASLILQSYLQYLANSNV